MVPLPVLVAAVLEIPVEEPIETVGHAEPLGTTVQREGDQDSSHSGLRYRENEKLLVTEKLANHDIVRAVLRRARLQLSGGALSAGRRTQQDQPPLAVADVRKEAGLARDPPRVDELLGQVTPMPSIVDLMNGGRIVESRHQPEGAAASTLRRRRV